MSIELDEGSVEASSGGPSLYYASAMPTGGPKAVLAIIPGYADHGARYAHVMGALAEHGIGSVAIDLRGHGRAQGPRGFCMRFEEFLDDARELRRLVEAARQGRAHVPLRPQLRRPRRHVERRSTNPRPWKGLVLSAPFFGLALEVPKLKILAGKLASRVYPKLGLPSGLAGKDMTHDPAKAKDYDADPLVFKNATRAVVHRDQRARRSAPSRTRLTPHAAALHDVRHRRQDRRACTTAKRFFDAAGSADKTWDPREGPLPRGAERAVVEGHRRSNREVGPREGLRRSVSGSIPIRTDGNATSQIRVRSSRSLVSTRSPRRAQPRRRR